MRDRLRRRRTARHRRGCRQDGPHLHGRRSRARLEVVGNATTIRQAWETQRPGGTAVVVGLAPPGVEVSLPAIDFLSEKTITGSYYGSTDPYSTSRPRAVGRRRTARSGGCRPSLVARGVRLSLGGSVYDPRRPMGKCFFNILATFAEFEVDLLRMPPGRDGDRPCQGRLKAKAPELSPTQRTVLLQASPSWRSAIIRIPPAARSPRRRRRRPLRPRRFLSVCVRRTGLRALLCRRDG